MQVCDKVIDADILFELFPNKVPAHVIDLNPSA